MIILNLNWSMHQTEMAITYLGKLISDIVNRGRNPRNGIRNNPVYCQRIAAVTLDGKLQNQKQNAH